MRSLLLCALAACGEPDKPADNAVDTSEPAEAGADTDADTDADSVEIPADNVVHALGDCAGRFREPEEYPNQLAAGDELQRYTLADPEAVCNDGTRAVLYVRAYTDEALRDVWELHLQGGSDCWSYASCAIRWCGLQYYDASKMSSAWAPAEVGAFGIADAGAENLLSGANHAYFYYCSSDAWNGQGSRSFEPPEEGEIGDTGGAVELPELPEFTLFRRGHTIIASAIAELEAGISSDLGEDMPPLSGAAVVIFNGTSAGASGARAHADWLTERLAPNGTQVLAVFDAAIVPRVEDWPADYRAEVEATYVANYENALAGNDAPPFMDESCLALSGEAEAWRCYDLTWVMYNHITTPFFVRQDLRDAGWPAASLGLPLDDHETAAAASLAALAAVQSTAIEGGAIAVAPGAYGPNCAQHVALETDDWWRRAAVEDASGADMTFQDAVYAWYLGDLVSIVDSPVAGDGEGPRSTCLAADEER